jgi:hypothetical protein
MLRAGDVLQLPIVNGADPADIRIYTLIVDEVKQAGGEPLYCFRDDHGPAICILESRLKGLRQRLGAGVAAALEQAPAPAMGA